MALPTLTVALGLAGGRLWAAESESRGRVYVFLWFDTEDYILPQSDDAAKRLAAFLSEHGVRATFKLVGEKARTLERRGRRDVIAALACHDIGYHSNTHSQHPTVAEYEAMLDWETGAEEFTRRERPGFEDVRRIFGQAPSCYGQPGSSWAPQAYAALKKWGVKVYLDEGRHVGLNGKPFWYGGLLNIFNTSDGPKLRPNNDWSNLNEAKAGFQQFYLRATARREGGILSLYFHPAEFVHREFWDAVNFAHGANPPREEWKSPPVKSPEESEKAFKYFEELVAFMKSFPLVDFVTASQAPKLFRDMAQYHEFSTQEIESIAGQVDREISFQVRGEYALSASEVFALLTRFVAGVADRHAARPLLLEGTPYGPSSACVETGEKIEVSWSQFSRTVLDVAEFLEKNKQVPNAVWLGSTPVSPESYLVALAEVTRTLLARSKPPRSVFLGPAHLAAATYVAEDSPDLWDWVIFPRGFRGPRMMALARLQAWTMKPAKLQSAK